MRHDLTGGVGASRESLRALVATCGCVTHYAYRTKRGTRTVAVNAMNVDPSVLVGVRFRHLDGASTWKYFD